MKYSNETGYPSVTDILKPFIDDRWFKPEHSIRGSVVHEKIKMHLLNLFGPELPKEFQPYFNSFLKFSRHIKRVLFIEKRLIDKDLGFCGQPDLAAKLDKTYGNAVALIDWKTSASKYKYWKAQLGGYLQLIEKNTDIRPNILINARLRSDDSKKPLINVYGPKELANIKNIFFAALVCYENFIK